MPKLKSHKGAAKRFRATASGGFKCRRGYRNHILTKKSPKQKRQLRVGSTLVADADKKAVARLLQGS